MVAELPRRDGETTYYIRIIFNLEEDQYEFPEERCLKKTMTHKIANRDSKDETSGDFRLFSDDETGKIFITALKHEVQEPNVRLQMRPTVVDVQAAGRVFHRDVPAQGFLASVH